MKNNKGIRETMFGDTFATKEANKNKGFGFARIEHNILFKQFFPLSYKAHSGTMINIGFLKPLFFQAPLVAYNSNIHLPYSLIFIIVFLNFSHPSCPQSSLCPLQAKY